MKINFTILCLTIIFLASVILNNEGAVLFSAILWCGYGLYKLDEKSD